MIFIIVFLGIIAISEIGSLILNVRNQVAQKSLNLVTEQLGRERDTYTEYKKQLEKELFKQRGATDLWAKKYFELETLLKKYETGVAKEENK